MTVNTNPNSPENFKTFKDWFKVAWSNGYIFLFFVSLGMIITEFVYFEESIEIVKDSWRDSAFFGLFAVLGLSVPWLIMFVVVYKGFYQHWKDLQNGTSR